KQAQALAQQAYERAPEDPNCAITYAFALYVQGRTTEGWEILQKLPPEILHDPHNAVYTAILLLDLNQTETAKEYIQIAKKGGIYAEERRLLEDEVNKAAGISPTPTPKPTATPTPAPSTPEPEESATPDEN
ncbi:MAG TPA: tetratricopeptide repeat protein, partial [Chthoniobacterales bacterium]|nr:tetratricopeptide repeat protein [Chthoniobacterales bacterium]